MPANQVNEATADNHDTIRPAGEEHVCLPMTIVLRPGQSVAVQFDGTDGEVVVSFEERRIIVECDEPDDAGAKGVIYEATFRDDDVPDGSPEQPPAN